MTRVLLIAAPSIATELNAIVAPLGDPGIDVSLGSTADLNGPLAAKVDIIAGPGILRCGAAVIDRTSLLRGLLSIGSGCDRFDQAEAVRRDIVNRTRASATVMLMLALCHNLAAAGRAYRARGRRSLGCPRTLDGAVVGLIGYGAIARDRVRRFHKLDVMAIAYIPLRREGIIDDVRFMPPKTLLANSDIVSLHAALMASSRTAGEHRAQRTDR